MAPPVLTLCFVCRGPLNKENGTCPLHDRVVHVWPQCQGCGMDLPFRTYGATLACLGCGIPHRNPYGTSSTGDRGRSQILDTGRVTSQDRRRSASPERRDGGSQIRQRTYGNPPASVSAGHREPRDPARYVARANSPARDYRLREDYERQGRYDPPGGNALEGSRRDSTGFSRPPPRGPRSFGTYPSGPSGPGYNRSSQVGYARGAFRGNYNRGSTPRGFRGIGRGGGIGRGRDLASRVSQPAPGPAASTLMLPLPVPGSNRCEVSKIPMNLEYARGLFDTSGTRRPVIDSLEKLYGALRLAQDPLERMEDTEWYNQRKRQEQNASRLWVLTFPEESRAGKRAAMSKLRQVRIKETRTFLEIVKLILTSMKRDADDHASQWGFQVDSNGLPLFSGMSIGTKAETSMYLRQQLHLRIAQLERSAAACREKLDNGWESFKKTVNEMPASGTQATALASMLVAMEQDKLDERTPLPSLQFQEAECAEVKVLVSELRADLGLPPQEERRRQPWEAIAEGDAGSADTRATQSDPTSRPEAADIDNQTWDWLCKLEDAVDKD